MAAQFQEIFNAFDKDGDGLISLADFTNIFQALGHDISLIDLDALLKDVDTEERGGMDFTDFMTVEAKVNRQTYSDEDIREAFKLFDRDKDGFLNEKELRDVMNSIGDNISLENLKEMIVIGDRDGDGKIGLDDFYKMMKRDF